MFILFKKAINLFLIENILDFIIDTVGTVGDSVYCKCVYFINCCNYPTNGNTHDIKT